MTGFLHSVRRRWRTAALAAVVVALLAAALLAAAGSLTARFVSHSTVTVAPRVVQEEMYALTTTEAANRIVSVLSAQQDNSALIEAGAALTPPLPVEELASLVSVARVSGATTVLVAVDTPSAEQTAAITDAMLSALVRRAEAATTRLADGQPDVTVIATPGATRAVPVSLALVLSTIVSLALLAGLLAAVLRDRLDPVIGDAGAVRDRWLPSARAEAAPGAGAEAVDADDPDALVEALVTLRNAVQRPPVEAGPEAVGEPRRPALVTVAGDVDDRVWEAMVRVFSAGSGRFAVVRRGAGPDAIGTRSLLEGTRGARPEAGVAGPGSEASVLPVELDLPAATALDPARLDRLRLALAGQVDAVLLEVEGAGRATRRFVEADAQARVVAVTSGRSRWAELPRPADAAHDLVVVQPPR